MRWKYLVGKNYLLKNKILIVGNAVTDSDTIKTISKQLDVVTIQPHELKKALNEQKNTIALWIHLDTFLDESYLDEVIKIPFLISTTTGLTHIASAIQDFYGPNLISLRNRSVFLSKISATAEHAWILILLWNNHICKAFTSVLNGVWSRNDFFREKQLAGQTLGIIGYGRLGKMVANYGLAFKMQVIIFDIEANAISEAKDKNFEVVESLEDLFNKSNIISIHANYNSGTLPIITADILCKIHKPLLLVNTARAGLVDEEAVIKEISERPYLYYFTDVLKCEEDGQEIQFSHLWKHSIAEDRVKISPHIGGANLEAAQLCEKELLNDFLQKLHLFLIK
jgi:D-3-phosphoglycerate dehydrogenase